MWPAPGGVPPTQACPRAAPRPPCRRATPDSAPNTSLTGGQERGKRVSGQAGEEPCSRCGTRPGGSTPPPSTAAGPARQGHVPQRREREPRVPTWVTGQGGEQAEIGTCGRHGDGPQQEQSPRGRQRSRAETSPRGQGPWAAEQQGSHDNRERSRATPCPAAPSATPHLSESLQKPRPPALLGTGPPAPGFRFAPPRWGYGKPSVFFLSFFFKFGDGTKRNTSSGQYPGLARGEPGLGTQSWSTGHGVKPDSRLCRTIPQTVSKGPGTSTPSNRDPSHALAHGASHPPTLLGWGTRGLQRTPPEYGDGPARRASSMGPRHRPQKSGTRACLEGEVRRTGEGQRPEWGRPLCGHTRAGGGPSLFPWDLLRPPLL